MMRAAEATTFFRITSLLGVLATSAALITGCVVKEAPPAQGANSGAQSASKSGDCQAQQDACVADCKAKAPDEASRQPCYTQCMRRSQTCE
jgi:hypothetical protein